MAVKGMIGAVYEDDTAPISDNVALLFDWTLQVDIRKEYTYGPELHGIPVGWHVKAEAYWAVKKLQRRTACVRLFIDKGSDTRCLAGYVELPSLKKTDEIYTSTITFTGVGGIRCETKW